MCCTAPCGLVLGLRLRGGVKGDPAPPTWPTDHHAAPDLKTPVVTIETVTQEQVRWPKPVILRSSDSEVLLNEMHQRLLTNQNQEFSVDVNKRSKLPEETLGWTKPSHETISIVLQLLTNFTDMQVRLCRHVFRTFWGPTYPCKETNISQLRSFFLLQIGSWFRFIRVYSNYIIL